MLELKAQSLISKKTLIMGEVNTGKTVLLNQALTKLVKEGLKEIAVLDLAPDRTKGVGGKIKPEVDKGFSYHTCLIVPPRMSAKTPEQAEVFARENAGRIEKLLDRLMTGPPRVLIINDATLYLQAGTVQRLWELITKCPTVVANAYYGATLGGGGFGDLERSRTEELAALMDRVIRLEENMSRK